MNNLITDGENEAPICMNCKRRAIGFTCEAFPAGIPPEILSNEADHRSRFPGDRGLMYDPSDPKYPIPDFGPFVADNRQI